MAAYFYASVFSEIRQRTQIQWTLRHEWWILWLHNPLCWFTIYLIHLPLPLHWIAPSRYESDQAMQHVEHLEQFRGAPAASSGCKMSEVCPIRFMTTCNCAGCVWLGLTQRTCPIRWAKGANGRRTGAAQSRNQVCTRSTTKHYLAKHERIAIETKTKHLSMLPIERRAIL